MKTFIIAEAGANHNRDYTKAIKLIDIAKSSGADAVKFQTYSSETLYSKNTPDFAGYKNINQLIKDIELPREWQKSLKQYCDTIGIEFMSTPFDENAINELYDLGVERFKIAGFESTDLRFLRKIARTKKPLIISVGIGCSFKFIDKILSSCYEEKNHKITLLHCNNAYPTPQKDINLQTMVDIKKIYNYPVGLSDHTLSTLTPSLAVALGATVIEKHFTLDKTLPGPDHKFALEPHELKEMIDNIRLTELSLGRKEDKYSESEKEFKKAGRSIVAKTYLEPGDYYNIDNITTKRPYLEGNIHASQFYNMLGKVVNKNYKPDDFIKKLPFADGNL
tara:strand:+ start:402 stop:1406 length:1005 start_codon:yes stop_codon:yes gene_type:complete